MEGGVHKKCYELKEETKSQTTPSMLPELSP